MQKLFYYGILQLEMHDQRLEDLPVSRLHEMKIHLQFLFLFIFWNKSKEVVTEFEFKIREGQLN